MMSVSDNTVVTYYNEKINLLRAASECLAKGTKMYRIGTGGVAVGLAMLVCLVQTKISQHLLHGFP